MSELTSIVPWQQVSAWVLRKLEDRHFRGKTLRLHLKNGRIISGQFERYSVEQRTFFVKREGDMSKGVPIDNVLFLETTQGSSSPPEGSHTFGGLRFSLADFPQPFVGDDGSTDFLIVHGEGSRDYADFREFLRQKGEENLPSNRVGRRGDFEYLATLAFELGFYAGRTSHSHDPRRLPLAKQGFQLDDNDLGHNLITVGSGAVNTFTRRLLEIYGESLPVRFKSPHSDELVIDNVSDQRVFSRRNDAEWNAGLIELVPNPFNPSKVVLIVAGLRVAGTQAALLALCDAVSRKVLRDRAKRIEDEVMTIPAVIVMAKDVRYVNGLETIHGYDLIS